MAPNLLAASQTYQLTPFGIPLKGTATATAELIISQVIGVLTVVAFVYFAIQVILAGYAYISSQGDKGKMEVARKRLTEGILGATIVVVAMGVAALFAELLGVPNIFSLEYMFTLMGL